MLSSRCLGSAHMRRHGVALAERLKILRWRTPAKRVVRSLVVKPVSEGVDEGLQLFEPVRQIV